MAKYIEIIGGRQGDIGWRGMESPAKSTIPAADGTHSAPRMVLVGRRIRASLSPPVVAFGLVTVRPWRGQGANPSRRGVAEHKGVFVRKQTWSLLNHGVIEHVVFFMTKKEGFYMPKRSLAFIMRLTMRSVRFLLPGSWSILAIILRSAAHLSFKVLALS